jgi:hypothetical protein
MIRSIEDDRGRLWIEREDGVEVYVRERHPEQTTILADYIRARQAFPSDQLLARTLGISRSRISAWKHGQLLPAPDESRLLSHLAIVVSELGNALHPESMYAWLTTEQYTLDGRTPIQALRDGHLAEVLQAVNATEHGAYI